MGTLSCHSNQSSYPTGIKKHTFSFPLPKDAMCYMERICLMVLEELSFENVDGRRTDGRTPDSCIYYKLTYEPSAQVS